MRILIITNQFFPVVGGIENLVRDMAPALRDRGHDVAVLTSRHVAVPEPFGEYAGIPVFRSDLEPAVAARDFAWVHRSRRWIEEVERDFAPDVVHAHDTGLNLWAHLRIRDVRRAPTVGTIQTSMPANLEPGSLPVACRLFEACDWVTGVSREVLEEARELVPDITSRSSVVPNAVPVRADDAPVAFPDEPRVLCLGRLVKQKGIDIAVAAMPYLMTLVPDVTLTIAGDGIERDTLRSQIDALGVADRVHLVGLVPHDGVAALLDRSSVVAMPSRFEGMPLAWLEAAARARPVVATAVHGLGELIEHGRTGWAVPPEDPEALADGLAAVLHDPALARSLGNAARALVEREHSLSACVSSYTELYARVIRTRRIDTSAH